MSLAKLGKDTLKVKKIKGMDRRCIDLSESPSGGFDSILLKW